MINYWKDNKDRCIAIHTMSNKWLNNIRKKYKNEDIKPVLDEIKRRKNLKKHEKS